MQQRQHHYKFYLYRNTIINNHPYLSLRLPKYCHHLYIHYPKRINLKKIISQFKYVNHHIAGISNCKILYLIQNRNLSPKYFYLSALRPNQKKIMSQFKQLQEMNINYIPKIYSFVLCLYPKSVYYGIHKPFQIKLLPYENINSQDIKEFALTLKKYKNQFQLHGNIGEWLPEMHLLFQQLLTNNQDNLQRLQTRITEDYSIGYDVLYKFKQLKGLTIILSSKNIHQWLDFSQLINLEHLYLGIEFIKQSQFQVLSVAKFPNSIKQFQLLIKISSKYAKVSYDLDKNNISSLENFIKTILFLPRLTLFKQEQDSESYKLSQFITPILLNTIKQFKISMNTLFIRTFIQESNQSFELFWDLIRFVSNKIEKCNLELQNMNSQIIPLNSKDIKFKTNVQNLKISRIQVEKQRFNPKFFEQFDLSKFVELSLTFGRGINYQCLAEIQSKYISAMKNLQEYELFTDPYDIRKPVKGETQQFLESLKEVLQISNLLKFTLELKINHPQEKESQKEKWYERLNTKAKELWQYKNQKLIFYSVHINEMLIKQQNYSSYVANRSMI